MPREQEYAPSSPFWAKRRAIETTLQLTQKLVLCAPCHAAFVDEHRLETKLLFPLQARAMHLSKILYYEGCTKLAFEPKQLKGLEIWIFEVTE